MSGTHLHYSIASPVEVLGFSFVEEETRYAFHIENA